MDESRESTAKMYEAIKRLLIDAITRAAVMIVALFFDIYETLLGYAMYLTGRHNVIYSNRRGGRARNQAYSRAAIVALYAEAGEALFVTNLLNALIANDFFIVLVSTQRLEGPLEETLRPLCDQIIERYNMGRDFGSFRIGLQWIEKQGGLQNIDTLALINDTLFFPKETDKMIGGLLAEKADWLALYENFRSHYHAQSFFQIFRKPVLSSSAFKTFWRDYKPFSSRKHTIYKGEAGLTRALKDAGQLPYVLYSTVNIRTALLAKLKEDPESIDLNRIIRAAGGHDFYFCMNRLSGRSQPAPADERMDATQRSDPAMRQAAIIDTAEDISQLAEEFNPAHALGLVCNHLFHAPIKRDICYRVRLYTIADIMTYARGFDPAERDAMYEDLRRRGVPATLWGFRRLLFLGHRI